MGLFDFLKKKKNDTQEIQDNSQSLLDTKLDEVNDVVEKVIDVILDTYNEYQAKEQNGEEVNITRDIFANVKDKIDSKLDDANNIIEEVIDVIIETYDEYSKNPNEEKVTITKDVLVQKFLEKKNEVVDRVNEKSNELENNFEEVLENEQTKELQEIIEETIEDIQETCETPNESFTESVSETKQDTLEENEQTTESIQEDSENTIEDVVETSEDTTENDETINDEQEQQEQIEEVSKEPSETTEEETQEEQKEGLFAKMKKGLLKTKNNLTTSIDNVFKAFAKIDEDFYEELEETLILSDLGARTSMDIIETLRDRVKEQKLTETSEVKGLLIEIISEILNKDETPLEVPSPTVILVIGVNGVGKTTTIGKLASLYKQDGKNVILAAGDTFRAAAIEQLEEWGNRSNIPVVKHAENSDSSAVIYDAIASAKAKKADMLICDTAGRLHNKRNLMAELEKINRVINKEYSNAHLETFLVLDGTSGQNAIEQAKQFNEVCDITGLVVTKLDGTAKGGVIISIKNELNIPVRFIGVGEQINDLQHFDAHLFATALFED